MLHLAACPTFILIYIFPLAFSPEMYLLKELSGPSCKDSQSLELVGCDPVCV